MPVRSVISQHHPLLHFTILHRGNGNQGYVRNPPIIIFSTARCDPSAPSTPPILPNRAHSRNFLKPRLHLSLKYVTTRAGSTKRVFSGASYLPFDDERGAG